MNWNRTSDPGSVGRPAKRLLRSCVPVVAVASFATGGPELASAQSGVPEWAKAITLGVQVEGGITVNPQDPRDQRNFGVLTTDDANRPVLNEALFTVSRAVDPKADSIDIGFKLQAMYGSDARIYQTLGVLDQLIHDRDQLGIIEASVAVRFPHLFANGLDVKAGVYPTPLGFETIDPSANAFYSHSYIFNYGLPFKHTGALATAHVSSLLDVYFGVDSGNDTFIGYGTGDNNNRPAGLAGIGLNLLGGNLTVLALTHIGPEDSRRNTPFGNSAVRYYNDIVVTWKAAGKLTLSAEGNYVRDDGVHAEGWGIATYASYALNSAVTLNGRGELFRDNNNFYVSNPAGSLDFANAQRGTQSFLLTATRPTTYSELTVGLAYRPTWLPKQLGIALIRPELRYDRALDDSRPFNGGRQRGSVTLASDIILGF